MRCCEEEYLYSTTYFATLSANSYMDMSLHGLYGLSKWSLYTQQAFRYISSSTCMLTISSIPEVLYHRENVTTGERLTDVTTGERLTTVKMYNHA